LRVAAALCAPKPASLSIAEAGAVPLAALTAWQGIFDNGKNWRLGRPSSSMRVRVGSAILRSNSQGTRARASLRRPPARIWIFVRQLGADTVIDYKAERFEDAAVKVDVFSI